MAVKLTGKDAANFILGYLAALVQQKRRVPKYLYAAACEARDVLTGGSIRGPLAVSEMENVANKLAANAAIRCGDTDLWQHIATKHKE